MWRSKVTEMTNNKSLMIFLGIVAVLVVFSWLTN
jgi:hypothetical protein